jgi:hypothetical protein
MKIYDRTRFARAIQVQLNLYTLLGTPKQHRRQTQVTSTAAPDDIDGELCTFLGLARESC